MASVSKGDSAPDFTLRDQDGNERQLGEFLGKGPVVIFFYPKDDTPICTKEACAFRDAFEDFTDAGATVIGVSGDGPESHAGFARRHSLPFTLLADEGDGLRRSFGVPGTLGLLPGRVTYVLDSDGTVRHTFSSQLFADRHVREALDIVRTMAD